MQLLFIHVKKIFLIFWRPGIFENPVDKTCMLKHTLESWQLHDTVKQIVTVNLVRNENLRENIICGQDIDLMID